MEKIQCSQEIILLFINKNFFVNTFIKFLDISGISRSVVTMSEQSCIYLHVKNSLFLSCHIRVQSESTPCSCLDFKELFAQNRRNMQKLSDCNGLEPTTTWFVNECSTIQPSQPNDQIAKWLWVRVPFQSRIVSIIHHLKQDSPVNTYLSLALNDEKYSLVRIADQLI